MKTGLWFVILIILVGGAVSVWILTQQIFLTPGRTASDGKIKVVATIYPLQSIIQSVGGDYVNAITLLPPGASPHTFEPTVRDLERIQGARVGFAIGYGLDDWATQLITDGTTIITVDQGISLQPSHDTDEGGTADPHYWLALTNARLIAATVAGKLSEIDPVHRDDYRANLDRLAAEIEGLRKDIQTELAGIKTNKLVTFHDAWYYFADEFGLDVVATFEPAGGKEPTPQSLTELEDVIRREKVKVLFTEPQLSIQSLQPLLDDLQVTTAVLDPLGNAFNNQTYLDLMRQNAHQIAEALKK